MDFQNRIQGRIEMFNIFQYLKLKGISMEIQKEYLDELSDANEKIEKFMLEKGIIVKWGHSRCDLSFSNAKKISKDIPIPQPTL